MQTQPLDANLCTISKSQEKGFLADFFFKHLFCLVFKAFIYLFKLSFVRLRSLFFLFMSCISPSLPLFLMLPLILLFWELGVDSWVLFWCEFQFLYETWSHSWQLLKWICWEQCVMVCQIFEELARPQYQWILFSWKKDLNFDRKSS